MYAEAAAPSSVWLAAGRTAPPLLQVSGSLRAWTPPAPTRQADGLFGHSSFSSEKGVGRRPQPSAARQRQA